jgi:hypothetical protein
MSPYLLYEGVRPSIEQALIQLPALPIRNCICQFQTLPIPDIAKCGIANSFNSWQARGPITSNTLGQAYG